MYVFAMCALDGPDMSTFKGTLRRGDSLSINSIAMGRRVCCLPSPQSFILYASRVGEWQLPGCASLQWESRAVLSENMALEPDRDISKARCDS